MEELNWKEFAVKFSGKEQGVFESLAYQLFCSEFDQSKGIFRFKNQTGIETEPITKDGKTIGFQAKYFESKVNKDNVIDSLTKAKRENPELTKVLLYINLELSESSKKGKKKPQYQIDIEEKAKELGLELEWRVQSHFEIQLAKPENKYLREYFFTSNKNIVDFLNNLKSHSESLLRFINTDIQFNDKSIKIDRSKPLKELVASLAKNKVVVVSGEGGCGKTAIIKELYNALVKKNAIYLFKAVEFNQVSINSFFQNYGADIFGLSDFVHAHREEKAKVVVIDSAERITDLEHQEALKEFISELLQNSWKIIFTTRLSYLSDLEFQLADVYRCDYSSLTIGNLPNEELLKISQEKSFQLPTNKNLKERIKNLFYLGGYLKYYDEELVQSTNATFRKKIWDQKIKNISVKKGNIHNSREECFLNLIKARSEENLFFISAKGCSDDAIHALQVDEIIELDERTGRYFITHDLYEEWGLELLIDRAFINAKSYSDFFQEIGSSLIIRRAFRNWLSVKLHDDLEVINRLIENVFLEEGVEQHWKDEIITSVLLSENSDEFFTEYKDAFLDNNFELLKRMIFLLRIACKEIDQSIYKWFKKSKDFDVKYVFTRPKGSGWNNCIELIFDERSRFQLGDLDFIIPLLKNWVSSIKKGEITRKTGLFALEKYQEILTNDDFRYGSNYDSDLKEIIIMSSSGIRDELIVNIEDLLESKSPYHKHPYYDFCSDLLKSDETNISALVSFPEHILKLADAFWFEKDQEDSPYRSGIDIEQYYSISSRAHHDYFPASALQTPIGWLLHFAPTETISFIIEFVNKTVRFYAKSGKGNVKEVELHFNDGSTQKQYVDHNLWCMYRGSGQTTTPSLLKSIHMALETHLLQSAKSDDEEQRKKLEELLLSLLKRSTSASISAVVASIVLANPSKFFDVIKILFSSKELFMYDRIRQGNEHRAKSLSGIGFGLNARKKKFDEERIKSCDEEHRKESLEGLVIRHQLFKHEDLSDDEFEERRGFIWELIDRFHSELPEEKDDTDMDKSFRLLLAGIDTRNMTPSFEEQGDQTLISLNPKISPELEKHREEALKDSNDFMKYTALKLWAEQKYNPSHKYGDYPQYENDLDRVIKETKEIVESMNGSNLQKNYWLMNHSIPGYTCSMLIQHYSSDLEKEDLDFCKTIVTDFAMFPFVEGYDYQISDGVEVSINTIPALMELYPDEVDELSTILLFVLFETYSLGEYKRICDYSIEAITQHLWDKIPEKAEKILQAYVKFKPLFNQVADTFIKSKPSRHLRYNYSQNELLSEFEKQYGTELENFWKEECAVTIESERLSSEDLDIIFHLIPYKTSEPHLLKVISDIFNALFPAYLAPDKDAMRYKEKHRFFERYAYFILHQDVKSIDPFILPVVDNITNREETGDLLRDVISAQDRSAKYDQFWVLWKKLYDRIIEIAREGRFDSSRIIHDYMLAWPYWKDTAKDWHSLKKREKGFYKKIVNDIGNLPSVLDAMSQFLNEIGSVFIDDGLSWLSAIILKQEGKKLERNTVYYLELFIRKYVHLNRMKAKKDPKIKNDFLVVLNFLIERGSVNAYLLRENIL